MAKSQCSAGDKWIDSHQIMAWPCFQSTAGWDTQVYSLLLCNFFLQYLALFFPFRGPTHTSTLIPSRHPGQRRIQCLIKMHPFSSLFQLKQTSPMYNIIDLIQSSLCQCERHRSVCKLLYHASTRRSCSSFARRDGDLAWVTGQSLQNYLDRSTYSSEYASGTWQTQCQTQISLCVDKPDLVWLTEIWWTSPWGQTPSSVSGKMYLERQRQTWRLEIKNSIPSHRQ